MGCRLAASSGWSNWAGSRENGAGGEGEEGAGGVCADEAVGYFSRCEWGVKGHAIQLLDRPGLVVPP